MNSSDWLWVNLFLVLLPRQRDLLPTVLPLRQSGPEWYLSLFLSFFALNGLKCVVLCVTLWIGLTVALFHVTLFVCEPLAASDVSLERAVLFSCGLHILTLLVWEYLLVFMLLIALVRAGQLWKRVVLAPLLLPWKKNTYKIKQARKHFNCSLRCKSRVLNSVAELPKLVELSLKS